ncbi:hypothetical protein [Neomesorhizobium albiziae]|uniref:hypothetical protein n=1 Tax=Neomesorhizobium albiziae TaxID=335020 RepID=UPI00122CFBA1|nr:hypothetical protein [Mesorhizobium albiziae]GLS32463.1 hypothetical protein GCM10007937_41730 [Mesorhizobium albiziae]
MLYRLIDFAKELPRTQRRSVGVAFGFDTETATFAAPRTRIAAKLEARPGDGDPNVEQTADKGGDEALKRAGSQILLQYQFQPLLLKALRWAKGSARNKRFM